MPAEQKTELHKLLTFDTIPDIPELIRRARLVAELSASTSATAAMIGGAPFFMGQLQAAIYIHNIAPLYVFSKREPIEQVQPDGTTRKVSVSRHLGFVRSL